MAVGEQSFHLSRCPNFRNQLSSRLAGGPANALAVLVPPLEDLVGVDAVLSRYTRDRCARHQRRCNDPLLLRRRAIHSLRPATTHTNFFRIAHKQIVAHPHTYVYTARPGRLRRWGEAAITFVVLQDEMSQLNKRTRQFVSNEHFTVDSTLIRARSSQKSRSGSAGNLHT